MGTHPFPQAKLEKKSNVQELDGAGGFLGSPLARQFPTRGVGMSAEFVGSIGQKAHLMQAIRLAFAGKKFDICALHKLPGFDYQTFAGWVRALHCADADENTLHLAKCYCVNYLLCPEATDEFEVEAYMLEIFPPKRCTEEYKSVLRIGCYELRRRKATA